MPTREELKAEVELIGRRNGHTLGPWLEVGHAGQVGCVWCDRWAFVRLLPPPGRTFTESFQAPCPESRTRDAGAAQ